MRKRMSALVIGLILIIIAAAPAIAQNYSFSLDREIVDVYWEEDGTLSLAYEFVFTNHPGASEIDYVDVGLPHDWDISDTYAYVNGEEITHIRSSEYVEGAELGLGSNAIQPGQTGTVFFWIAGIRDVLYVDSDDNAYASAVFSPSFFDSQFVAGITDLTIVYHLPPGVQAEEPRWHTPPGGFQAEPFTGFDSQGRVTYTWRNEAANGYTRYPFGASFPASYVPANAISQLTFLENLGIDFGEIFGFLTFGGICLVIAAIPVISIISARRRRLQYLPPKIAIEGHGIKRGLTAIEAAILLEEPMDKILTMILFAVIKKGAATVLTKDPLNLEVTDPPPEDLRKYEKDFLIAMQGEGSGKRRKSLQNMMVNLVKGVSRKMKGFSRRESRKYYREIIERAWAQVEKENTPEVRSEVYDKVMEWTMLDREYDDRTRRVFQDQPVFIPQWWHRYNPPRPRFGDAPSRPASTINRPTPGGTSLPHLPGSDFAASVVTGAQNFAGGVIGNLSTFTSGVTQKTNPVPKPTSSTRSRSSGGSGGSSCACACACAGCACACAGGGR